MCTQCDKMNYLVHYRNLKYYVSQGMEVTAIHSIIEFKQSPWMKAYIDGNTEKRDQAKAVKNDFEINIWKLLNNSVFGKTMEDVRRRRDIHLVTNDYDCRKICSRPTFKNGVKFTETFSALETTKYETTFNKPIYVGFSVLELSKLLMYEMYYDVLQPFYPTIELLYMDTDSFFLNIPTNDLYHDLKNTSLKEKYTNKIGNFKDEAEGKIIEECIFLRSKCYSWKKLGESNSSIKSKGVTKAVTKKYIKHEDFKKVLSTSNSVEHTNISLRSKNHNMELVSVRKKAMCAYDDKRYILNDAITTLPYGYEYGE